MHKKILWIEDDYYAIKGLVRPIEIAGFKVDVATSALEGYYKAKEWITYDLLVIDLIIPLSDDDNEVISEVKVFEIEEYVGIGLAKWLVLEAKVQCPILLMSVVNEPIERFKLREYSSIYSLSKKGLLPSRVKEKIFEILKMKE